MARLRYNGIVGTLGGSLSSSATSVTFTTTLTHSGGVNVATITNGDYLPLSILDSTGVLTEIVYLTAYTAGGTSGTIIRGCEGTTGTAQSSTFRVVNSGTVQDFSFATSNTGYLTAPSVKVNEGNSTQTWASGNTSTFVQWSNEEWDTHGFWSAGQNTRFTVPQGLGGKYHIDAQAGFDINSSVDTLISVVLNGVEQPMSRSRQDSATSNLVLSYDLALNAGDYVELMLYQGSGTTKTIAAGGSDPQCFFAMFMLTGTAPIAESYSNVIDNLTGKVHRWKFDDISGSTVEDSVGSLDLTMSGTYSRGVSSPTGLCTNFGSGSTAVSSGSGSLPTGAAERTIVSLIRSDATASESVVCGYGSAGTRTIYGLEMNVASTAGTDGGFNGTDSVGTANFFTADAKWHLFATSYSTDKTYRNYLDGDASAWRMSNALNTATGTNFQVAQFGGSYQFLGDIDDIIVFNRVLSKTELDRIYQSVAGIPGGSGSSASSGPANAHYMSQTFI